MKAIEMAGQRIGIGADLADLDPVALGGIGIATMALAALIWPEMRKRREVTT